MRAGVEESRGAKWKVIELSNGKLFVRVSCELCADTRCKPVAEIVIKRTACEPEIGRDEDG